MKKPFTILTVNGSAAGTIPRIFKHIDKSIRVQFIRSTQEAYNAHCNAVLLLGGADINPFWYGQPKTHSNKGDKNRDMVEWALVHRALKYDFPLMGICRGHQIITAACGGILHQDLFANDVSSNHGSSHMIEAYDPLTSYIPTMAVNSYHHQAVRKVPFGFQVGAVSDDGVIESIWRPGVLGVQWHPEMLWEDDRRWSSLFEWFIDGLAW